MIRVFKHYISRWSLLLVMLESAWFYFSVYAGVTARFYGYPQPDDIHGDLLMPKAAFFALVMIVSMTAMGRYRHMLEGGVLGDGFVGESLNVFLSFLIGLIAVSMGFYLFPNMFIGRGAFAWSLLVALLGILAIRWFFINYVMDMAHLKRRVLIYGAGSRAKLLGNFTDDRNVDHLFVGYWPVEGESVHVEEQYTLRDSRGLSHCVRAQAVDEIVIAHDDNLHEASMTEILDCKTLGVRILDLPGYFEREQRMINMDVLGSCWWIFNSDGLSRGPLREITKKVFDIGSSLLILFLGWPIMLLTTVAIWIESRGKGPILFIQDRVGYGGRIIQVMKFRSMRTDAEKDGVARWAQKDDDRVTRVGRFIRKMRIDEMPQIFNVLKGEMSLVGPRPERPHFVDILSNKIPYYKERLRVKPGITGWAQICYGYGASEHDAAEKLKYDLYYVKNHGLFFDLLVLVHSMEVVLFGWGASSPRWVETAERRKRRQNK
ncbi:MAG: TIGR03013 family PEP-CTERM/XrtA system glycosyltransferase [Magnetococcales bacterium]|nr:TIGR03013 family PEP-CTERM/XrtA system glycosyltransferase [Magnetococcales bacterium]